LKVWLNGALVEEGDARISPGDRGFLLGDGVFETLRCYAGRPFDLDAHLGRLEAGAAALGIEPPPRAAIAAAALDVLAANGLADARMRITLTSGAGPPGLARGESRPTALVTAGPLQPWPPTATAVISRWRRDERSPLAGVKTTSLAESVVALREARAQGADEAIVLNRRDDVCEATTANVFCVRGGRVETPSLQSGCLAGITRERVLRACREEGLDCAEAELPASVLDEAEELFLTSSTREVQPLVAVGGRPVGDGQPGPVTRRLARVYADAVLAQLELE
jgi:branched-chain amino acid aminotransferase